MAQINPHFIFIPFFAQGHLLPLLDVARLTASRGPLVSFVVSPVTASRLNPLITRITTTKLPLQLIILDFPSSEAGLPPGLETLDQILPNISLGPNFLEAMAMLQLPLLHHLKTMQPWPTCIVSDPFNVLWTKELADELNVPRVIFHGSSCFHTLCIHNIYKEKMYERMEDELQPFVVPGMLPLRVEVRREHALSMLDNPMFEKLDKQVEEALASANGIVLNSFKELESEFIEMYKEAVGLKVWSVGPVSLCNDQFLDRVERGNKSSVDVESILTWLDSNDDNSVVYVSFGSLPLDGHHSQLIEVGLALESLEIPFVWVIKEGECSPEFEHWLSESEYEVRVKSRGVIIRGWSPQTFVLSHRAVGAFVTHCGWNSTLEAIAFGVPIVTWPLFADQFLNEKLAVQVLGVGVEVSEKKHGMISGGGIVGRKEVEKAVMIVLKDKEMRRRAKELGEKAKKAMQVGGSSYCELTSMVEYILELGSEGRCADLK